MKSTTPQKAHSELDTLLNLETYCRSLIFAQDYKPGDDLGQQALALAHLGIRSALLDLDKIRGAVETIVVEIQE